MKKITLILILLPMLSQAQQKPGKVAFTGYKGNYIYNLFKPASPQHPDGEVTQFRLDRRKSGEERWKPLQTFSTPASFEELEENTKRAITNVFEYREETAYTPAEVWPIYSQRFNYDSLGVYLTQQHLALAFNILLVDTTASPADRYQYQVVQLTKEGRELGKYSSLPVYTSTFSAPRAKALSRKTAGGVFTMEFGAKKGTEPVEALLVKRKSAGERRFNRIVPYYSIQTRGDSIIYSIADDKVSVDEVYSYTVTPLNRFGGGASPVSDTLMITNIEEKLLLPKAFTAKADSIKRQIKLDWAFLKPDVVAVTKVYRSTDYESGYSYLGSSNTGEYIDDTAVPGQKYYYYLTLTDKLGRSSEPSMKVYALMQDGVRNTSPLYVSLQTSGGSTTVEWQDFNGSTRGFKVYRTNAIGGELYPISDFIFADKKSNGQYSFTDRNRPEGTVGYAVRSESLSNVLSDMSKVVYLTVAAAAPAVPVMTDVTRDKNFVRLFWTVPNDTAYATVGFNIFRKEGNGAFTQLNRTPVIAAKSSYTDSLSSEGAYVYKVQAVGQGGKTSDGEPYELSSMLSLHAPNSLKSFLDEGSGTVLLEWQPAQGAVNKYAIYRYSRGSEPSKIGEVDRAVLQYRDVLKPQQAVYYFVVTLDASGHSSAPSNEVSQRFSKGEK